LSFLLIRTKIQTQTEKVNNMTAQMATMLSSGWRIMAISPSKGFMGTFWEQETHWQLAMLLKGSGFVCSIVNLDKMDYNQGTL